jgi:hypothetical protein
LVRVIAAICRQNGGEMRVKGELVDTIGEATAVLKSWDSSKQELVLTVNMGTFGEVFRVVPERRTAPEVLATPKPVRETPHVPANFDPLERIFKDGAGNGEGEFLPKNTTLDDERAAKLERDARLKRSVALIRDELQRRKQARGEA